MSLGKQQTLAGRSVTKCGESNTTAFTDEKFPLHAVIVQTIISHLWEKQSDQLELVQFIANHFYLKFYWEKKFREKKKIIYTAPSSVVQKLFKPFSCW